jgi:hypothetical protein
VTTVTPLSTTPSSTGTTPVCILGQWGPWSACSAECTSDRKQYRSRSTLNDTTCSDRLDDTQPCNQSTCQQCTITREVYIGEFNRAPPSDGWLNFCFL